MAIPALTFPFVRIPVDHPKDPMPGQVCRVGITVGVRAYDELYETWERGRSGGGGTHEPTMERIYGEGRKPVTFHHTTWQVRVRNQGAQTAGAGRIVNYYDQPVGPDGDQSNCAVQETVAVPDATMGLLLEPVPPQRWLWYWCTMLRGTGTGYPVPPCNAAPACSAAPGYSGVPGCPSATSSTI